MSPINPGGSRRIGMVFAMSTFALTQSAACSSREMRMFGSHGPPRSGPAKLGAFGVSIKMPSPTTETATRSVPTEPAGVGLLETCPIGTALANTAGLWERSQSGSDDETDLALCSSSALARLTRRRSFSLDRSSLFRLEEAFDCVGESFRIGTLARDRPKRGSMLALS